MTTGGLRLDSLPAFSDKKGYLNVIAETPKGSRNKYSFDSELGIFRLKKILPAGAVFPYDFGFIPSTQGDDGDPLDVLTLMDEPVFPGCLIEAHLLGVMEASQSKGKVTVRNDRFIATARKMKGLCQPRSIKGLSDDILDQIEHFFVSYNAIEGKRFKLLRISDETAARKLIDKGAKKFREAKRSA
jgi:inorganic pyrophosphatase